MKVVIHLHDFSKYTKTIVGIHDYK